MKNNGDIYICKDMGSVYVYADSHSTLCTTRQMMKADGESGKAAPLQSNIKDGVLSIYLYKEIGESGFLSDIFNLPTPAHFANVLDKNAYESVTLYVNSPGGSAFAGISIKNMLERVSASGKPVRCVIDGMCASAATIVAMGADKIEACEGSRWLIHKAHTMCIGNADRLEKVKGALARTDNDISAMYARRTGRTQEEILEVMSEDELLTADEARDLGFIDKTFANSETKISSKSEGGATSNEMSLDEPNVSNDRQRMFAELELLSLEENHNGN